MNPLSVLAGILLIFFLPGYALLKALFPRRKLSAERHLSYLVTLSVLLSVTLTILTGALLGFLPRAGGERGLFQGAATGAPILELALGGITLALLGLATARGAFPALLGRARTPLETPVHLPPESGHYAEVLKLRARIAQLERELARAGSARGSTAQALKREIHALAREAAEIEARASEERYGRTLDSSSLRKTL